MAKNVDCSDVRPNTIVENDRILRQLQSKRQVDDVNARDLEKLISKLNRHNVSKRRKSSEHVSLPWPDKNVENVLYGVIPNFPPGSWWGIRMDCSRDRVHDPFNIDVHAGPMGAVSVCTSGDNINEDVDFGDFLTLTGQFYNPSPADRDPLVMNYKYQVPLRLIRSYNLTNSFAPKTGYRYDGLYMIISHWIGVSTLKQKLNKFALMRVGGQNPVPWNVGTKSIPSLRVSTVNNTSHCSPCCAYKLRKSTNSKDISNITTISTVDQQKVADSTIVTRRVFKKCETNPEGVNVASASSQSSQETLQNFEARSPETHTTNISIRTNLYDSSHSVQQDVKKNSLMSFCRTLKPISVTKHAALQKNVNRQINALRYSSTISNLSNGRFKSSLADCLQARKERQMRVQNIIHPKHIYTSAENKPKLHAPCKETILQKESNNVCQISKYNSKESRTGTSETVILSSVKQGLNGTATDNFKTDSEASIDINQSRKGTSQNSLNSVDTSQEEDTKKATLSESCVTDAPMGSSVAVQELKMFETFNSLTPDKILNLIDEEKCRPLSKLLIGNMIGLTPEESVILDTKPLLDEQDVKSESAVNYNVRCHEKYKLSSRQSDSSRSHEKVVYSTRRTSVNNSTTSKEHAQSSEAGSSNRQTGKLRIFKLNSTDKEEDSGKSKKSQLKIAKKRSTVKRIIKSSIKRPMYRKQRREITNLLIDAKIGPKIRGPRNRRLRHINDMYAKMRNYDSFSTVIYTAKKSKRNVHEKKQKRKADTSSARPSKTFKLQDISSRKRHANVTKVEHRFANLRSNDTNNNSNKSDNNLRSVPTAVASKNCKTLTTLKSKKRRTVQSTTESHRMGRTKSSRHICQQEQAAKPCTSDATTQCSFLPDFPSDNSFIANGFAGWNNQRTNDISVNLVSTNVKSEVVLDATKRECKRHACQSQSTVKTLHNFVYSQNYSCVRRESYGTERVCAERINAQTDKTSSAVDDYQSSARRVSAFVPVNAIDNESRIAQLRSIGFKPIPSYSSGDVDQASGSSRDSESSFDESKAYESKVTKRDVAEEYNKYASEENDIVIYMDEELQYQDIEEEEGAYTAIKEHVTPISTPAESLVSSMEYVDDEIVVDSADYDAEDFESPWHGWRKVTANGKEYWIGW